MGDKALLAQTPASPSIPKNCKFLYDNNPGGQPPDCSCCSRIKPDGQPDCRGRATIDPIPKLGLFCGWTECERGEPSYCGGVIEPPAPACGLPEARPVNQCELTAIADTNPNDELCCKPIDIKLDAVDMFDEYPYTPCEYNCPECVSLGMCPCNPECEREETRGVNREIGINLSHPYLTPIWEQTAKNESNGIFNIFRPAEISAFEELDAHSEISYSQTGFKSLEPPVGKFYYNYLGGVQKAKEWVTTKVLMPYVEQ